MFTGSELTTARVLAAFTDEVAACGGHVSDTFDDNRRLFTRAVLPRMDDLRPGDRFQAGVALKAVESEVCIHPYLFRLVCRNGAIIAHTVESRVLEDLDIRDSDEAIRSIREVVAACCEKDAFTGMLQQIRTGREADADLLLSLMPHLSRLSSGTNGRFIAEIMDRFFGHSDQSQFGLMNAVTSTARDTRDPQARWDLEELGGAIAVGRVPAPRPGAGAAAKTPCREPVATG